MILPWSTSLAGQWDAYCDATIGAWFWHRSGWMQYCEVGSTDALNMSFAVVEDGEIVGICPIILSNGTLTYYGAPCPEPLYRDVGIRQEMVNHLTAIVGAYTIDSYDLRGTGLDATTSQDISWMTRVIDLNPPSEIEAIRRWLNVRKSYKSLIHRGQRTHLIETSTHPRTVQVLHDIHREQAGRETRPQQTWDLMAAWVQQGYAYLCTAWNSAGLCDGAVYIYTYKGHEYYGHAATRVQSINHALLWEAIRRSTAQTFETGWQRHSVGKKDHAIEFFRRGFGGADQAFPVSRYYV